MNTESSSSALSAHRELIDGASQSSEIFTFKSNDCDNRNNYKYAN